MRRPVADQTQRGVVKEFEGGDGDGPDAEALLWAVLDKVMFYAPWSVAILLGLQLWLIRAHEM